MTDHGDISSHLTLRGGVQVSLVELAQSHVAHGAKAPRYVFGTGGIFEPGPIHHALKEGYLAFDTAQQYNNEREVGEAIRSYPGQIDRKDLFIISKVASPGSTVEETLQGIRESVEKIGLGGYVDLFLIHNPNFGPEGRKNEWLALEQAKKEGLVRAIGVSN
jgi:diketogulonate reductase-like aldo/keto reductase